jgi:alpha-L-rhamnosidase
MIKKYKISGYQVLIISVLIFSIHMRIQADPAITNLMVEYSKNPIGIDVKNPRFSWQMIAPENERDYVQSAYQIVITNPGSEIMLGQQKGCRR